MNPLLTMICCKYINFYVSLHTNHSHERFSFKVPGQEVTIYFIIGVYAKNIYTFEFNINNDLVIGVSFDDQGNAECLTELNEKELSLEEIYVIEKQKKRYIFSLSPTRKVVNLKTDNFYSALSGKANYLNANCKIIKSQVND